MKPVRFGILDHRTSSNRACNETRRSRIRCYHWTSALRAADPHNPPLRSESGSNTMAMSIADAAIPHLLSKFNERRWRSLFGLSFRDTESLWHLPQVDCKAKHLLWFLFYLKTYPTDSVATAWASCDEKTWRKHLRLVAGSLNLALSPVSHSSSILVLIRLSCHLVSALRDGT